MVQIVADKLIETRRLAFADPLLAVYCTNVVAPLAVYCTGAAAPSAAYCTDAAGLLAVGASVDILVAARVAVAAPSVDYPLVVVYYCTKQSTLADGLVQAPSENLRKLATKRLLRHAEKELDTYVVLRWLLDHSSNRSNLTVIDPLVVAAEIGYPMEEEE